MHRQFAFSYVVIGITALSLGTCTGCRYSKSIITQSPTAAGLNTRDLIDPVAHDDANELAPGQQLIEIAERIRKDRQQKLGEQSKQEGGASSTHPNRNILCLSGGGSFGAYSAGVLVGWSERGDRPTFDVVTGISTGALIAVPAFLGPKYDEHMKSFYTTLKNEDLFKIRLISGLFGESLADTSPLKHRIDTFLTAQVMHDLVEAHKNGRRLYIGTTEQEGGRFVVWDIGAIATRNGPDDRALIINILLGSSAAPGLFPSANISVTVDAVRYTEKHVDGGASHSVFFRPPFVAPDQRSNVAARDLGGAKVYVILAGKLFADPQIIRPWSFAQAGKSLSTLIYAHTRGDLQRLYTLCLLTGMDFYVSAIPPEFSGAVSSADFKPSEMTALFEEGRRTMTTEKAWSTVPPGFAPGEGVLMRSGPDLIHRPRGPLLPLLEPKGTSIPKQHPIPVHREILPSDNSSPIIASPK